MPFNVSGISSIYSKPMFFNTNNYDSEKFVQNSYAVKGNTEHPESRTNYGPDDYRGLHAYYLA